MAPKIGFVGTGIMGRPMIFNILKAGYETMVYNRTAEKTVDLKSAGSLVADTPKDLGEWADAVIFMLTGPEAIDSVMHGETGILAAKNPPRTMINMSTVPPAYSEALHALLHGKNIHFIDAPVSGSKKPAEDGTLVILAGGPREPIEELEPLFLAMGKKVVYCGEAGQGSAMKMTVNLLLGIMMAGLSEALNLGERCGLKKETVLDTVLAGPLGCGLFTLKKEMLLSGDYPTQFPLKHMTKDVRFALQTADEKGAAVPLGSTIFQLYRRGVGQDLGDMDFAAIKKVLATLNDA